MNGPRRGARLRSNRLLLAGPFGARTRIAAHAASRPRVDASQLREAS